MFATLLWLPWNFLIFRECKHTVLKLLNFYKLHFYILRQWHWWVSPWCVVFSQAWSCLIMGWNWLWQAKGHFYIIPLATVILMTTLSLLLKHLLLLMLVTMRSMPLWAPSLHSLCWKWLQLYGLLPSALSMIKSQWTRMMM